MRLLFDEIIPFRRKEVRGLGVGGPSASPSAATVRSSLHVSTRSFHRALALIRLRHFELLATPQDVPRALDAFRAAGGPARGRGVLSVFGTAPEAATPSRSLHRHCRALLADPGVAHLGSTSPTNPREWGVFRPDVWEKWRSWTRLNDGRQAQNGRAEEARPVYVDCGTKD